MGKNVAVKRVQRTRRSPASNPKLRQIGDATWDAQDLSEQTVAFLTLLEEHQKLPFEAIVLDVPVMGRGLDVTDDDDIVAVCSPGEASATSLPAVAGSPGPRASRVRMDRGLSSLGAEVGARSRVKRPQQSARRQLTPARQIDIDIKQGHDNASRVGSATAERGRRHAVAVSRVLQIRRTSVSSWSWRALTHGE